jgi:prepilin-type N-terminal cleavage/methylation domain-containing protein
MRRPKSFTLVELLVVIAIIAILIAILLPVCITIRRRALALVCPIAYRGEDGGVYLTDPKGGHSLQISEPGWKATPVYGFHAPMSWSPCGRRLAYNAGHPVAGAAVIIHEPTAGKTWRIENVYFSGWIDYDTFISWPGKIYRVETGTIVRDIFPMMPLYFEALSPTPLGVDHPYVARIKNADNELLIAWLGKEFQVGGIIFRDARPNPYGVGLNAYPVVDPLGEYVATRNGGVVKALKQNSQILPSGTGTGFIQDWTEDSQILATSPGSERGLFFYDKEGKLLRKITPPVNAPPSGQAAYRKYGRK